MSARKTAVLLMSFGGPETLEEIPTFLRSLMFNEPPPHVEKEVIERYRQLGGGSPLPEITRNQARGLQEKLAQRGYLWKVYTGMRHAQPLIGDAIDEMLRDGVTELVAISLTPYRSEISTDAYEQKLREELAEKNAEIHLHLPKDWNLHPGYIDALAEILAETLAETPAGNGLLSEAAQSIPTIFSAHGLPVRLIEEGDPYADQLQATAKAVADKLGLKEWYIAYQSRSAVASEPWLGPQVEEVLDELQANGKTSVMVNPIGFVADHLETFYDNDIEHKRHAAEIGLHFYRCLCLNDRPRFLEMLADLVMDTIGVEQGVG